MKKSIRIAKIGFYYQYGFYSRTSGGEYGRYDRQLGAAKKFEVENITLHSLAFKRASKLAKGSQEREKIDRKRLEESIASLMKEKQLEPYYLYRQKNMLDWGENIGYAKLGTESILIWK